MNTQRKLRMAALAWIIGALSFGLLAIRVNWNFAYVCLALCVSLNLYAYRFRCKDCGTPAIRRNSRFLGFEYTSYTTFIDPYCSRCGKPLD